MKVLVVGGGGREHAIATALSGSGAVVYAAMRNRNPGIIRLSKDIKIVKETDVDEVSAFAKVKGVELAVIGPEAPLEVGLADRLLDLGIGCVGPSKAAARLETSKRFTRELMSRHHIPGNLGFATFDHFEDAKDYVMSSDRELAIKPVGLTGGKGVKVQGEHLRTKDDVIQYLEEIFEKGIGGGSVVLEERAEGEEFTLQAFCDGSHVVPMPLVQDHKRAFEGDEGPNTGGMGSYSMQDHLMPFVTEKERGTALDIMKKVVEAMDREGCPYVGVLYGQFMLTRDGPKVIEFNARFGDPEAMNVLSLISTPFSEVCSNIVDGHLTKGVDFANKATVCKYVVPKGYGMEPSAGKEVRADEGAIKKEGARLYYAMVEEKDGKIMTGTSRALAVVGIDDTLEGAESSCERALKFVTGEAIYVRHDIGRSEVVERRVEHMARIRRHG